MSPAAAVQACGPVHWSLLPHPPGEPAEPRARAWLAARLGTRAEAVPLQRDARGRPRLDLPGLDCNWSHSGGGLLLALARGVRVGVDVEAQRPRPRALALAERFFAPGEAAWLRECPEPARAAAFTRLWCAKEAVLKAHGRGLVFGLDRLEFADEAGTLRLHACDPALGAPADWTLASFAPAPGLAAALAWRAPWPAAQPA